VRLDPPVGEALRAALGAPAVLRRLSSSPRSRVWLAEFDGSPAIVKQVTGGADAGDRWVPVPASVTAALDGLVERLNAPGQHALLHGDPCPDNAVRTAGGMVFVDLEQASLGDGCAELAYLQAGFPTCWCATSAAEPVLRRAEEAYRSTWRAVTGADVSGNLAEACAGWLIRGDGLVERAHRGRADQLARLAGEDWRWGTATARQRLRHRLGVVAALGADHRELAGLASVCSAMCEQITTLWPAVYDLPAADGDPVYVYQRSDGGPLA
jgi:hypothetical protein